jgi:serralysin
MDINKAFIKRLMTVLLPLMAADVMAMSLGNIRVDGDVSDWSQSERLNNDKDAIYGKFISLPRPTYLLAIESSEATIAPETTIWLNTDDDPRSGYQVWGQYGGAEYYINIHSDEKPYLYSGEPFGEFVAGPLKHAYGEENTTIEIVLPAPLIGSPKAHIGILADLNNTRFLPSIYSSGQLVLYNEPKESVPTEPLVMTFDETMSIDGKLDDWTLQDQIDLPMDLPPTLSVNGKKVYAKYVTSPKAAYLFAVETNGSKIAPESTFWFNTDDDEKSGYQVWGSYGGIEYFVNINEDERPYLYKGDPYGESASQRPLAHAYDESHQILEFAVPAELISSPKEKLSLIGDINNTLFFPSDYTMGQLDISNTPMVRPKRQGMDKRIGIVYSQTSRANFYDADQKQQKAHSRLFMAVQEQALMAGIPYDLLSEEDLNDLSRLIKYDLLVFPSFASAPSGRSKQIAKNLYEAVYHHGINTISAGNWMTNDADGSAIDGDAYRYMKSILGIHRVRGGGPVELTLQADDVSHPIMQGYETNETIRAYRSNRWYSEFAGVSNAVSHQAVTTLASQSVTGKEPGTYGAVIATKTGSRHVHFSTLELLSDTDLLWPAILWTIYGDRPSVALKMGRDRNLFIARNDIGNRKLDEESRLSDRALYAMLMTWKEDWSRSTPIYQECIALGDEIGSHSLAFDKESTDPDFEFNQAMDIVDEILNPTWRTKELPDADMISTEEDEYEKAEAFWSSRYERMMHHTSQPIINWPWHDHAEIYGVPYDVAMFTDSIKKAYEDESEFLTSMDIARRITAFKDARITVEYPDDTIRVTITGQGLGNSAVEVGLGPDEVIGSVKGWYAYDDRRLFLATDGGDFEIEPGSKASDVTHITSLPMRSELLTLKGNGKTLSFSLEGEGVVEIALADDNKFYDFTGVDDVELIDERKVRLTLDERKVHSISIIRHDRVVQHP